MAPYDWNTIRQNIFAGESGGDYNALFGYSNRPGKQFEGTRLTDMTVDQALNFASPSGPYGQWVKGQVGRVATPMGAYQVVGTTLREAKRGLGLRGDEKMTPDLQERIGRWIYETQGTGAWEGYRPDASARSVAADTMQALGKGNVMTPMDPMSPEQNRPKGLLGLLSNPDVVDALAIGFAGMSLNPNAGVVSSAASRMATRAEERKAGKERNATAEWLRSQGLSSLADGVMSGALPATTALQIATDRPKDERTAMMKNYEYARQTGYTGSFNDFLSAGGGGGSVINVGGEQFKVVGDYVIMPDPNSPTGNRFVPIPGSKAALEAEAATQRQGAATRQGEQKESVVGGSIDYLIGKLDKGGMFNLPEAGIVGNVLGNLGANQEAVDFRNELSTVQANIAFDRLQQMREASKTGGALGAVSERELDLLINAYGNLQQSTSPERLKQNLLAIKRIMTKIENDPVASRYYYGQPASGQAAGGGFSVTGKVGN